MKGFDIILLIGAGQGMLLTTLLFAHSKGNRNNSLLGLLLGLLSVHLILVGNDHTDFFLTYPHLSRLTWTLPLLYGPLIYVLTCSLTTPCFQWQWRYALLLIPFLAFVAILLPYYALPAATKIAYLRNYEQVLREDLGWMNQLTNVIHVIFFAASLRRLRVYERRLHKLYSSETYMRLLWLKKLLLGIFMILVFSILVFYARKFQWPVLSAVYPYHFLGIVILMYWIGYKALAQPRLFRADPLLEALQPAPDGAAKVQSTGIDELPAADDSQVAQALRLQQAMEVEKLYLDPELDLIKLARHLGLPRYQVSAVLNGVIQKNFYDFINDYRVEAFKQLAGSADYAHYTLLALAYEAGFNSKSTFNAVFKKKTGQTPSQYYQNIGAKASVVV